MLEEFLDVRPEVAEALAASKPVVALESTIIAHGLPYPRNVEVALKAEDLVRTSGAIPATIALLDGKIRIGLVKQEIEKLAQDEVLKVSRRDLSYALMSGVTGATTVCATMIAAHSAGIEVFATGGIGGVHRGGEASWDVSADLIELARTPIVVVSAGAKAILDLPRTLEYLETQGVPVAGYGTDEFPAFYSRKSGVPVELRIDSPEEAARLFRIQRRLGQAILVANPIPEEHEIPAEVIEDYLKTAFDEMEKKGIRGKEITPFLLARIVELSDGRSLDCNVMLLENNIRVACAIAGCLASPS